MVTRPYCSWAPPVVLEQPRLVGRGARLYPADVLAWLALLLVQVEAVALVLVTLHDATLPATRGQMTFKYLNCLTLLSSLKLQILRRKNYLQCTLLFYYTFHTTRAAKGRELKTSEFLHYNFWSLDGPNLLTNNLMSMGDPLAGCVDILRSLWIHLGYRALLYQAVKDRHRSMKKRTLSPQQREYVWQYPRPL